MSSSRAPLRSTGVRTSIGRSAKRRVSRCSVSEGENVDSLPRFPTDVGLYLAARKEVSEQLWKANELVMFTRRTLKIEGVEKSLNILRHPYGLDPSVLLLCIWMPRAELLHPLGELQVAKIGKVSERWFGRLQRTLENARCQLEGVEVDGDDSMQMRTDIGMIERNVVLSEQGDLYKLVTDPQFWEMNGTDTNPLPNGSPAWKVSAESIRLFMRYRGLPHSPQIISHITNLNFACSDKSFDHSEFQKILSPNKIRPRTLDQDKKMLRYHQAKETYKEAYGEFKEAQKELRRVRRVTSIARHELYRAMKEVRQVWR